INLDLEPNTILGLAGPSGSGKSTLLRCIQQLESLSSGIIEVTGKSGFMFQDFQLFPHMTVLKNLTYAPRLHLKTMNKKNLSAHRNSTDGLPDSLEDIQEQALSLLTALGIADKAQCLPHQLSGGQKQRVALARSLMMHPSLLLCDEPTSGLDSAMIEEIIVLLQSVKAMGVTMVIASHDLTFLTRIADRLVVLKGGALIADLTPAEVANPIHYLKQKLSGADYEPQN
ncbi:MAG: ATP-binding cassette domain-containing protein, partial [Methylococcales bacterium]|nr:ATP-binding cassette domain-containing protein [Methylococcales bacterium]